MITKKDITSDAVVKKGELIVWAGFGIRLDVTLHPSESHLAQQTIDQCKTDILRRLYGDVRDQAEKVRAKLRTKLLPAEYDDLAALLDPLINAGKTPRKTNPENKALPCKTLQLPAPSTETR